MPRDNWFSLKSGVDVGTAVTPTRFPIDSVLYDWAEKFSTTQFKPNADPFLAAMEIQGLPPNDRAAAIACVLIYRAKESDISEDDYVSKGHLYRAKGLCYSLASKAS